MKSARITAMLLLLLCTVSILNGMLSRDPVRMQERFDRERATEVSMR